MTIDSLNGRWNATATCSTSSEIKFSDDDEPDPNEVADWLNAFDDNLVKTATPVSGLVLTIEPALGAFTEMVIGNPAIEWFDAEGVLAEEVSPFDGTIVCNAQGAYLRPKDVPEWATPVDGRYRAAILRYDDGDTKIADNLRVADGRLVRTVNIVTDELYLNRVIIVYERDKAGER